MNPFVILREIAERIAPGRIPSYTEAYVMKALELIESDGGIGRQRLSKELRMGEGSIRTLVKRLKNKKLIMTSRKGMVLTDNGHSLLDSLRNSMIGLEIPSSKITVSNANYAILVRDSADYVIRGIEQRDLAIIAGAKGATTLIYNGKSFLLPGMDIEIDSSIKDFLLSKLKPHKDDVLIIGTAVDSFSSEIGAKSAALDLLL